MKKIKKDIDNLFDKVHDEEIKLPASVILTIAELPSKKAKRELKIMETKTQKAPSIWRTKWMRFAAVSMSCILVIGGVIGGYLGLRGGTEDNVKSLSVYYDTLKSYNETISSDKNLDNFIEKLAEYNFSMNVKSEGKYKNPAYGNYFDDPDKGMPLNSEPEFINFSNDSTVYVSENISYVTDVINDLRYDGYYEYGNNNETEYRKSFNLDGTPADRCWTKKVYYRNGSVNTLISNFTAILNPAHYNLTTQSSKKIIYTSKNELMASEIFPTADNVSISIVIEINDEDKLKIECSYTSLDGSETTSIVEIKLGGINVVIPQEALDSLCVPQNLVFNDENNILWDEVPGAYGYVLSIKGILNDNYVLCIQQGKPLDFDVCSNKQTLDTYFDINQILQEEGWSNLNIDTIGGLYIEVSVAAINAKGEYFAEETIFFFLAVQKSSPQPQEVELEAPQNLVFNDENNTLSWDEVPGAYGYFLRFKVTTSDNTVMSNSQIGNTYFDMNELLQTWTEHGNLYIEVFVAAKNAEGRWYNEATVSFNYNS